MVRERVVHSSTDILQLDVGGVTEGFKVRRSLLTSVQGSALEAMFSGRHALPLHNDNIFIDRNPRVFIEVLDYLRNNMQLPKKIDPCFLEKIEMELEFWGLITQPEYPETPLSETGKILQAIYDEEPLGLATPELKAEWRKNGKFDLQKIVNEHNLVVDESLVIKYDIKNCNTGRHDGQFLDDCPKGFNRYVLSDGKKLYEGQFNKSGGYIHGIGRIINQNGQVEQGLFENGVFKN